MPPRSRILAHAVSTSATVGVGMIPLHRLPRPVRTGYMVLPGVFTSALLLLAQQRTPPRSSAVEPAHKRADVPVRGLRAPTVSEAALSLAVGGAVAGTGAASIRIDRGIENLLRRRGVPAPRLMMGLASGALMLSVNLLEHRSSGAQDAASLEHRVLDLLTEEDPMDFTPGQVGGTPAEEYRPEAEAIASLLRADGAITQAQLDAVWQEWFSRPLTAAIGPGRITALAQALNALSATAAE